MTSTNTASRLRSPPSCALSLSEYNHARNWHNVIFGTFVRIFFGEQQYHFHLCYQCLLKVVSPMQYTIPCKEENQKTYREKSGVFRFLLLLVDTISWRIFFKTNDHFHSSPDFASDIEPTSISGFGSGNPISLNTPFTTSIPHSSKISSYLCSKS